jgi:hypothetical protein
MIITLMCMTFILLVVNATLADGLKGFTQEFTLILFTLTLAFNGKMFEQYYEPGG